MENNWKYFTSTRSPMQHRKMPKTQPAGTLREATREISLEWPIIWSFNLHWKSLYALKSSIPKSESQTSPARRWSNHRSHHGAAPQPHPHPNTASYMDHNLCPPIVSSTFAHFTICSSYIFIDKLRWFLRWRRMRALSRLPILYLSLHSPVSVSVSAGRHIDGTSNCKRPELAIVNLMTLKPMLTLMLMLMPPARNKTPPKPSTARQSSKQIQLCKCRHQHGAGTDTDTRYQLPATRYRYRCWERHWEIMPGTYDEYSKWDKYTRHAAMKVQSQSRQKSAPWHIEAVRLSAHASHGQGTTDSGQRVTANGQRTTDYEQADTGPTDNE